MNMKRLARSVLFCAGVLLFFSSFANAQDTTFKANLTGKDEVPPVNTPATGRVAFQLSSDGKNMTYTLSVSNIEDVTMAHIHIGSPGETGKPVAALYPTKASASVAEKPEQKMNGAIATGTIRASSLMGPLKGKTIADLVAQIQAGKAYVNVHTKEHPDGEIRGTIQ
jgi:hypothetical protein